MCPVSGHIEKRNKNTFGLIAEEVEATGFTCLTTYELNPDWNSETDAREDKYRVSGVNYQQLSALLLQEIKRMKKEMSQLTEDMKDIIETNRYLSDENEARAESIEFLHEQVISLKDLLGNEG